MGPWQVQADVLSIDDAIKSGQLTLEQARQEYQNALYQARSQHDKCEAEVKETTEHEAASRYALEQKEAEIKKLWEEIEQEEKAVQNYKERGNMDAAASAQARCDSLYADVARHEEQRKQLWRFHQSDVEDLEAALADEKLTAEILKDVEVGVANRLRTLEEFEESSRNKLTAKRNLIFTK